MNARQALLCLAHRYRPRTTAAVAGLALVGLLALSIVVSGVLLHREAVDDWKQDLSKLSLLLAENTAQSMTAASLVLDSVSNEIEAAAPVDAQALAATAGTPAMHQMLLHKIGGVPQVDVVSIVGSDASVLAFSRAFPAPPIRLDERDYFEYHRRHPDGGMHVSAPVQNKGNGAWTFYISRRISGPDGRFLGVVLVGLSCDFFSKFFHSTSIGEHTAFSLYRSDYTLLARWPAVPAMMGKRNLTGSTYRLLEQGKTDGVLQVDSPRAADQGRAVNRLAGIRLVRDYPLAINVTVTDEVYLAGWRRMLRTMGGAAVVSLLVLAAAIALIMSLLRRQERDAAMAPATAPPSASESAPAPAPAPGARILLVEDTALNRQLVCLQLGTCGYSIDTAENGALGLQALAEQQYDLVLMDGMMPVMDGYQACQALRAREAASGAPRLPVIALTAGVTADDRQRCVAAGMDDYLAKPFTAAQLRAMVERWLTR
ncbi:response regulator [Janthinobacterium lividum]|uniref:response regulator n=1 Tax=Janthinobacterium lividum TaxID=29581 RepID=UPI00087475D9|nr:response regulator [Janthinobacterium lividum]MCC7713119.1 response regulator [Janthinobacterium lividum]OEZ57361.1 sensor histidine kinase RcsC [Janthinobacterium lividum]WQE26195.1 response regulator [Janthinobacterium lividum]STQ97081.1 Sensor kinase protein RcsC [Janthinobacterium lividum]